MATTDFEPQRLDEKYHFLLRRLHSLSGIIPIGAFLIEHMLTNSMAWYGGKEKFNESVHWLHGLPWLLGLEIFGIFLPIAFHAIYGVVIALTSQSNVSQYPYFANWRYFLQRLTGYITVVFIIVHLLKFRFADWVGWGPVFIGSVDPYEITRTGLTAWRPGGNFVMPAAITFTFYWIGLASACFHLANGIWSFCIVWGLAISKKGQQRVGVVGALVGLLLFAWGSLSLYAFAVAPAPGHSSEIKAMVKSEARSAVSTDRPIGGTTPDGQDWRVLPNGH
ncbi:MAG TPA: succinate dehydrogenase [Phycisphaerae bacterium]|nr:succinate dehydrogenase [Phycisphaerae bacterium]